MLARAPVARPVGVRSLAARSAPRVAARRANLIVRAQPETSTEETGAPDVDKIVKDLADKWDKVENKTSVIVYTVGATVLVWFSSTIVNAVNSVPILPKVLELVGLGYTAWFTYRYLLFKSSRQELISDIEEVKKKITGDQ